MAAQLESDDMTCTVAGPMCESRFRSATRSLVNIIAPTSLVVGFMGCGEPQTVKVGRGEAARAACVAAVLSRDANHSLDSIRAAVASASDSIVAWSRAEVAAAHAEFDRASDALIANVRDPAVKRRYDVALARRNNTGEVLRSMESELQRLHALLESAEQRSDHLARLVRVRAYADSAANHSVGVEDSIGYAARQGEMENVLRQWEVAAGVQGQAVSIWVSERTVGIRDDPTSPCADRDIEQVERFLHGLISDSTIRMDKMGG